MWAAGGIGEHTAAAAVIGGAAGVVLDTQLALLPEAELPEPIAAVLRGMDGSETQLVGGLRVLRPRGVSADALEGPGAIDPATLPPVGQDGFLAARFRAALRRHLECDTCGPCGRDPRRRARGRSGGRARPRAPRSRRASAPGSRWLRAR